jgi:hypothetical protein
LIDSADDDTIPQSIEVASMPFGRSDRLEKGSIKIISRLPSAAI